MILKNKARIQLFSQFELHYEKNALCSFMSKIALLENIYVVKGRHSICEFKTFLQELDT